MNAHYPDWDNIDHAISTLKNSDDSYMRDKARKLLLSNGMCPECTNHEREVYLDLPRLIEGTDIRMCLECCNSYEA